MTNSIKTVNLYDEPNGVEILVDAYGDIVTAEETPVARVIGHALYCCSLDDARESIRREYCSLNSIPLPGQFTA